MHSTHTLTGLLAVGILVAGLLMTGCVSSPALYDDASNGKTVTLAQGSTVMIRLKENPTTGYRWEVTVPEGLSLVRDEYTPDAVPTGIVGSGGIHTWLLQPTNAGTFTFRGTYMQPWMNVTGTEQTFALTLVVR
ncbi:MAG: protease inhibitor I42 family protein [Methanomicrobiales archaeon]|nr:protease inhibitor I42 family protein [Methanomicrobiales archaeon]